MDAKVFIVKGRIERLYDDVLYLSFPGDPDNEYDIDIDGPFPDNIHEGDTVMIKCLDESIEGVSLFTKMLGIVKVDDD